MTDPSGDALRLGLETFGTAVGLAVVVGALSIVAPDLAVVPGTLAALAVAGWSALQRRTGRGPRALVGGFRGIALAAAAVGGWAYLAPPTSIAPFHGLLIGLGLLPLWTLERRTMRGRDDGAFEA